jgi:hypothetical protein
MPSWPTSWPTAKLSALAADRPKYFANCIGSKQKLVDWIWANTPDGVQTVVARLFYGSSVVGIQCD